MGERQVLPFPAGTSGLASVALTETQLEYRDPVRISRDPKTVHRPSYIVEVQAADGLTGIGESFPIPYYGETGATLSAVLPELTAAIASMPPTSGAAASDQLHHLSQISAAMDARIGRHGAAKAGIEIALHDLVAKRAGVPLHELFGLTDQVPPTDITLGIDRPEVVAERAARVLEFPALKVKLGGRADLETLEAVRAIYAGPLRVDANTGWNPDEAAGLLPELVRLGVELIEQPFPPHRLGQLRWLQERSPLPIVADESAVTIDDLDDLVGVVAGVNVKLVKCGGVGAAYRMVIRARELGLKVLLGCMGETSVGICAAASIGSLADWVDLDSCLLLAADPFEGLELDQSCRWRLPSGPGLGLTRRPPDAGPTKSGGHSPDEAGRKR